jgi:hypothetical protein
MDRKLWHRRQVVWRWPQQRFVARDDRPFEGPAVRQLQAAFAAAWAEATGVLFTGRTTLEFYENGVPAGLPTPFPTC